jgi:hypothetical protein
MVVYRGGGHKIMLVENQGLSRFGDEGDDQLTHHRDNTVTNEYYNHDSRYDMDGFNSNHISETVQDAAQHSEEMGKNVQ